MAHSSASVCPTQVGIHPVGNDVADAVFSLPHAGGDTPDTSEDEAGIVMSAPRRWGYTRVIWS